MRLTNELQCGVYRSSFSQEGLNELEEIRMSADWNRKDFRRCVLLQTLEGD